MSGKIRLIEIEFFEHHVMTLVNAASYPAATVLI